MSDFVIKQGDTSPALEATLTDGAGDPFDITGATVTFHMTAVGNEGTNQPVVDADATVVDAGAGVVQYDWAPGDTADSGVYSAEFEVTYNSGVTETFPNDGYFEVVITEEVA